MTNNLSTLLASSMIPPASPKNILFGYLGKSISSLFHILGRPSTSIDILMAMPIQFDPDLIEFNSFIRLDRIYINPQSHTKI